MKNSTFRPFTSISKPSSRTHSHIMQRKGYCWEYQRTAACSKPRCALKHQCANCEGQSHSASRCSKPLRPFFNSLKPTASHTTTHLPSQKDWLSPSYSNKTQSFNTLVARLWRTSYHFLAYGFSFGFPLGTEGFLSSRLSRNHPSVNSHKLFVHNKLSAEISIGRIKCPFLKPPLKKWVSSPLGVVPKRSPNAFWLIHDLSFSSDSSLPSVNSLTPKHNSSNCFPYYSHITPRLSQTWFHIQQPILLWHSSSHGGFIVGCYIRSFLDQHSVDPPKQTRRPLSITHYRWLHFCRKSRFTKLL